MNTPKTYLDNLLGCRFCGIVAAPGFDPLYTYKVGERSVCYTFGFYEPLAADCHVVSFNYAKDGDWYKGTVAKRLIELFGTPNERSAHRGIAYYVWKEAKEA